MVLILYKLCNIDWNKITKEQKKIDDDKTKLNKDHIQLTFIIIFPEVNLNN